VTPAGVEMGTVDPFALGFAKCTIEDLKGGTAVENAAILRKVLSGEMTGPVTDTVILNAGAGLYVAGTAPSVEAGCKMAAESIKAGKPMDIMAKWVASSNKPDA
jgi:anthranilate phosphoribosyltransferase